MIALRPDPPRRALCCAMLLLSAAMGCAAQTDETPAGDSMASTDTGTAGMDHSTMAGVDRPAARDSNQAFLRMMSDHHEGLIAMADSAEERAQDSTTRADARQLLEKQRREQQEMLAMLERQYQDSITPMVMPSNRAMLDSTLSANDAAFDPTFYRQVINHHREGIEMVAPLMPHLAGEARQMAERMVADQRREIDEFERKAQARTTD